MNTNAELRQAFQVSQAGQQVRLDYRGLRLYGSVVGFGSSKITVKFPGSGPTTHDKSEIHVS